MKGLSPDRPMFDYLQDQILAPAGIRDAIINERSLILEARLNNQKSRLEFKVLKSQGDSTTEIKLDLSDIALVTHLRLSVVKVQNKNGYIVPITPDITYADKELFTGVLEGETEAAALGAIWGHGATLSLESKQQKRLSDFDTLNALHIPETKVAGVPSYGESNEGRGYYALINPFVISGKSENTMELKLAYMLNKVIEGSYNNSGVILNKDADGLATSLTPYNVVRLRLRCLVALNAADAYTAWLGRK